MVDIVFETHATSFDNENGVASGWFDVRLSPKGTDEAKQLGQRYADSNYDAIFCSDLKRAYQTATIAFDFDPKHIFSDWRLREINYGDYTQTSKQEIDARRVEHLDTPYANGESYNQVINRMGSFVADLKNQWDGKTVLIIGHRATFIGLEHFLNNKPMQQCLTEAWQWQPGWHYSIA